VREARKEDPYDFLCVLRVIFATFALKRFSSNGTQSVMTTFVWCSRNAGSRATHWPTRMPRSPAIFVHF